MSSHDARQTLSELGRLREDARGDVKSSWYPLIVFGLLLAISAPFSKIWHGGGLGLYWIVAFPLGYTIVARYYRRRELLVGLGRRRLPYILTSAFIFVAAFLSGAIGSNDVQTFGPPLAVSVGYLVFAILEKSLELVAVALALAGLIVVLAITSPAEVTVILILAFGLVLLGTGLIFRNQEKSNQ